MLLDRLSVAIDSSRPIVGVFTAFYYSIKQRYLNDWPMRHDHLRA
jgi:hypothetical protein